MKKLSAILPAAAILLCSCGVGTVGMRYSAARSDTQSPELSKDDTAIAYSYVVGNCDVTFAAANSSVKTDFTVKGMKQEYADEIAEKLYTDASVKDGALTVSQCCSLGEGKDAWAFIDSSDWKNKVDLNADTSISLPESMNECSIECAVGNISIHGFSGVLRADNGVGNVTVDGSVLSGASEIDTGTGNVDVRLGASPEEGTNIKINAGVGDINFVMPESINASSVIDIEAGVGSITFDPGSLSCVTVTDDDGTVSHDTELKIEDKCTVRLHTGTGSIDIVGKNDDE